MDFKGIWDWLKFNSSLKFTSLESRYEQPRNRFSIGLITPFLNLKIGDVNPVFNEYILNGSRIRGINSIINTKYFTFNYVQGELTRAVQRDLLENSMVISNFSEPLSEIFEDSDGDGVWDSAEDFEDQNGNGIWDEEIESGIVGIGRDKYTFKKDLFAADLGFTIKNIEWLF